MSEITKNELNEMVANICKEQIVAQLESFGAKNIPEITGAIMLAVDKQIKEITTSKHFGDPSGGQEKVWKSGGEFLQAVMQSTITGNVDKRLVVKTPSGMTEGVSADGGYLIPPEYATEIIRLTHETGQLSRRVKRIPMNTNRIVMKAVAETSRTNGNRWGGVLGYWVDEGVAATKSKPTFRTIELNLKKLGGLCYATDELLADASGLQSILMDGFAEEFAFLLDDAIINGTGAGQPQGILNAPCLVTIAKESGQAADAIVTKNILNMWNALPASNRNNAIWAINQDDEVQLWTLTLAVGTGGVVMNIYALPGSAGNIGGTNGRMLGREVLPLEQCNALGDKGDIILIDPTQYILGEKAGIEAASSIHVLFTTGENTFRAFYRVDGQMMPANAVTAFKGTTSRSPAITLAAR